MFKSCRTLATNIHTNYPLGPVRFITCLARLLVVLSLYISLSFTNFSHLRKNSQECGSSFYFYLYIYIYIYIYIIFFFFEFSCVWKVILILILDYSKRSFHEKSPNSRRLRGEMPAMMESAETKISWASCVRVVFISRINIHSVRNVTLSWINRLLFIETWAWDAFVHMNLHSNYRKKLASLFCFSFDILTSKVRN